MDRTNLDGVINPANVTLRVRRALASPNTWNGRHWRVKHRISQDWEEAIGAASADLFVKAHGCIDFPNALIAMCGPKEAVGYQAGRVRVAIAREVPSPRNFIRDDDNLRFSVKPLLDALKRLGFIRNDSRKWIELPTPEQRVSTDGEYWTEIIISEVVRSAEDAMKAVRERCGNRRLRHGESRRRDDAGQRGDGDMTSTPQQERRVDHQYECGCYWYCGNLVACKKHAPIRADAVLDRINTERCRAGRCLHEDCPIHGGPNPEGER